VLKKERAVTKERQMSKKARFANKRSKGQKPQIGRFSLTPKTVIQVTEGEKVKTYKSFNTLQSAVKKLKRNSALPGSFFYALAKEGKAEQTLPTGSTLIITATPWSTTWEEFFEKEAQDGK
jgi:adenine-specific DNA methylase